MKKLLRITSYGSCYRRGRHYPGWFHAFVSGEDKPRYYTEDNSFNSVIADLKAKGIDTAEYEQGLDNWVKTGKGFSVLAAA